MRCKDCGRIIACDECSRKLREMDCRNNKEWYNINPPCIYMEECQDEECTFPFCSQYKPENETVPNEGMRKKGVQPGA